MDRLIKIVFFALIIKPLALVVLGINLRGREKLPRTGPAIIAANHNSHLDALVLMGLFPLSQLHKVRPVAAADYFLSKRWLAWVSLHCLNIVPFDRSGHADKGQLFGACHQALDQGDILILFPEGSRGSPEKVSKIKKGLFYLLQGRPEVKVTPVVMYGLGRALPRGEALFVPFNCDVIVGDPLPATDNSSDFIDLLGQRFEELFPYCLTRQNQE
ncbi:MAG: lysophospholipid acyltransferase family protein [Methylococcales bacterium]|nr:lysophospholipid acyltransferase family protein [Methylococcales bacterium]